MKIVRVRRPKAGAPDAEHHRLTILHHDRDFETISEITEQPHRWIVPAGTAD